MASPPPIVIPILSLLLLFSLHPPAIAQKELTSFTIADSPWLPSQNRTLVSQKRTFAAGFRTIPSSPDSFFFAVWVKSSSDQTVVWSLNRDSPVGGSSGLAISSASVLSLNDSSGRNLLIASSSNASGLVLEDGGNLVFGNWSSFDHPTDTLLADQPLLEQRNLTSGDYRLVNAMSLFFNGSDEYWKANDVIRNLSSQGQLLMENANTYIMIDIGLSVLRRLTLDTDGNLRVYSLQKSGQWRVVWQATQELCKIHGTCGINAICQPSGPNATTCSCPPGYRYSSNKRDCERKSKDLPIGKFLRLDYVSFRDQPGMNDSTTEHLNFDTCMSACLKNRSCVGFSYKYSGKQDCVRFYNHLIDGYWSPATELATFVGVSISETEESNFTGMITMIDTVCPVRVRLPLPPKESKTTARNLAIIITLFTLELLAGILSFWAFLRKYSKYRDMARTFGLEFLPAGGPKRFSYAELKAATKDFSNEIGGGGYGVVYKGELPDRRVIAVKRLRNVGGGEAEFWAEVTIIARMHHLNLVRMWGFCAEKEQRLLVYEYIPNGSLDKFLFPNEEASGDGPTDNTEKKPIRQKPLLDWNIRYRIALGVARAVAYLHEECLEWVLHCDIKPENILLEDDFCPKVSDFGLSKLTNKKDKVTMSRIRGTRGYLAPEWVIHREPITAKADVYSFGMVLLEIVTGVRNNGFQRSSLESEDWYFPKWAFEKMYVERKVEDILDSRIADSYDDRMHFELVERMVKTAMWCLQDRAEMRPSMGKVAKMLEGTVEITEPGKPAIFCVREE